MAAIDTKQAILDAAQAVVQAHGYNGLSFRELAKVVGIKSASIHYHFPTKGDLGAVLARRYTDTAIAYFDAWLAEGLDARTCITHYANVFRAALLNDNRMCLCGIMAAERDDLPAEIRTEIDRFTEANVTWLAKVLGLSEAGVAKKALQQRAVAIFAAISGAQLVARGRGDIGVFDETLATYRAAGLLP